VAQQVGASGGTLLGVLALETRQHTLQYSGI